jgi:3-methyl-2-oxobutanoate hydroxymethyltransferase
MYDLLGFFPKTPRFAKRYADLRGEILNAVRSFVQDVKTGVYPASEHMYTMLPGEMEKLQKLLSR